MRVTKIIREYVEKTIIAKMPYGAPTDEFEEARKKLDNACEEIEKKIKAYAAQLVEAANKEQTEGFRLSVGDPYHLVHTSWYEAPLAKAATAHEKKIRQNRAAAIESILVELELGATKADLERLIEEAIA